MALIIKQIKNKNIESALLIFTITKNNHTITNHYNYVILLKDFSMKKILFLLALSYLLCTFHTYPSLAQENTPMSMHELESFLADKSQKQCHEILGIPADSTASEIKTTYRKLSLRVHPDKQQTALSKQQAKNVFIMLSTAYNNMMNAQGVYAKLRQEKENKEPEAKQDPKQEAPLHTYESLIVDCIQVSTEPSFFETIKDYTYCASAKTISIVAAMYNAAYSYWYSNPCQTSTPMPSYMQSFAESMTLPANTK